MNKSVLTGLVVVVIAVSAATYFASGGRDQRVLQYVSADTVLFAGSVKPVDVRKYLELSQASVGLLEHLPDMEKLEEGASKQGPFAHFLIRLYLDYLAQFRKGPDQVLAHYGMAEQTESAVYMVGAIPVARLYLRDPAAFLKAIGDAEQAAGLAPTIEQAGDMQLRRYTLKEAEGDTASLELIIASGADVVVITIDSSKLDDTTRALALGQQMPANSLASGQLAKLARAHELDDDSIFYIDFVEIGKSLVDPESSLLGQHLQRLNGDSPRLTAIQTAACQQEIPAFLSNVPRIVGGLKTYEATASGIDMTMVYDLEIVNANVLKTLTELRGVLPRHLLSQEHTPLLWFGLGIDIDKIAPTVAKLVRSFEAQTYECEPLLQAQQAVKNKSMVGLLALGFVRGTKGVSAAAYSFDLAAQSSGVPQGLDAIVTLSADDPLVLWQMAAKWLPPISLPENGDPVDVPLPKGGSVKVALDGNHLVAYVGEKSTRAAQYFKGQDLSSNGVFGYGYDYALLGQFASLGNKDAGSPVDIDAIFQSLAGMRIGTLSDFHATGWRTEVLMRLPKAKPKPST